MGKGTLTIYSASAGSGKTYKLTGIYLAALFRSRYNYRKMLAVTFTNKATAEMKLRILDNLHKLASGDDSEYLSDLAKETGKTEEWIRRESQEVLHAILHDFSRFSVSTIDSFFQKILRAFAREIGLHSGFSIELDHSTILSSAVYEMISAAANDTKLKSWLITYAMSNIGDEKSWNLKDDIIKLSQELFKEKFKILSDGERTNLENKEFLLAYIDKIKALIVSFEKKMLEYGKKSEAIFNRSGLTDDMFYRKGMGVPKFIRLLAEGIIAEPNSYTREITNDPPRWSTGAVPPQLGAAISGGLASTLEDAIRFYDSKIIEYKSAGSILSQIYALGILSDVLLNVHRITSNENRFLLSDAGELLNLITAGDQSPFIYEKVGNRFENFMIDEFQDTSIIQWKNFKTLIENSMAEGFDNLVVGDVKQSIYRWRNSDWQILGSVLHDQVDNERFISKPLTTNWRSHSNIIKFNNTLFTIIPDQIDETLSAVSLPVSFRKLYSEAVQIDPGIKSGGYVRIDFIENSQEIKWQDQVLEKIPGVIESFQDKGYCASDIGIIVRDGKEGAQVLKRLIDFSNSCSPEKRQIYNYNAISNDSLLLSNSPVLCFIISVMTVVNDPSDMISKAIMLRFYLLARGDPEADTVSFFSDNLIEKSGSYFPEGYEKFLSSILQIPLFEAIENIIGFFSLGDYSWNVPYLNTFQDYVVSFTGSTNSDISSFLDWWEMTGKKKSVILPGNQNAVRILTIHKSKGLEFKVVILPFLSWNLDHISSKQPVLWVRPGVKPFDELGIVPVKYSSELLKTVFAESYKEEKYSVYLDNINLLYVALTRAKDAIYGFSVDNPRSDGTIAGVLKSAVLLDRNEKKDYGFNLLNFFNSASRVFEFGAIPQNSKDVVNIVNVITSDYVVSHEIESLRLKLHGENYFSGGSIEVRKNINYGKIMHEVFEGINTREDITASVRKLVLEGKLPEEDFKKIEERVRLLIQDPRVAEWFLPGNVVMKEAGILMPNGNIRRPDRVILKDGKAIIIDFKFGEENPHHALQVDKYRQLLIEMGYRNTDAFLWYVDKNKVVTI